MMKEQPLLCGLAQSADDRAEPILRSGNSNCGGCGMSNGLNMLSRAAGTRNVQVVIPACCGIVTAGQYPYSAFGAPVVASTFASSAAVASGLAQIAKINGDDTRVICWAGDGGTYDIGMATLSAAAERNEDVLYICYDNEIYGNTGGQRSSATPIGATTTTTPAGKDIDKKDVMGIMAAHRIPYCASVSIADPADGHRKMQRALDTEGFRFLHLLSPCPTGWKSEPAEGIDLVRLAIRSGLYPIYEVVNGFDYTINETPDLSRAALEKYFSLQGRFRKNAINLDQIQAMVQRNWDRLKLHAEVNS
ncbi:MAG: pyruvate synthase subunit beta [Planctomycetes bacterium]|nr:pyruvate synthase subunit beta [Planctomycetota bacterium]